MFKKNSGFCPRFSHVIHSDVDELYGPSKVSLYAQLIEAFYQQEKLKIQIKEDTSKQ